MLKNGSLGQHVLVVDGHVHVGEGEKGLAYDGHGSLGWLEDMSEHV